MTLKLTGQINLILLHLDIETAQLNHWSVGIPHGASLINTHSWNGELTGLKSVTPEYQPRVANVFYSFRLMVMLGFMMFGLAVVALYLRIKKRLFDSRWFFKICLWTAPSGFIALWCGWITAEMGRQPWVVYHLLKTADAVSSVSLRNILISFALIVIVYGVIFGYFYFYFLHKTIEKGPEKIKELAFPIHQPFQYMPPVTTKGDN